MWRAVRQPRYGYAMGSSSDDGGLSVKTLVISGLSAAAAAVIVPLLWEPGTLIATAVTPIVVALVSEALRRPADRVRRAAPVIAKKASPPPAGDASGTPEHAPAGRNRVPRLKVALITGGVAFAVVAVALTATEILAGGSMTGHGRTTLFGGSSQGDEEGEPSPQSSPPATDSTPSTPTPTPTTNLETTPVPESTPTATSPSPSPSVSEP
jgi:hypothetical protein